MSRLKVCSIARTLVGDSCASSIGVDENGFVLKLAAAAAVARL